MAKSTEVQLRRRYEKAQAELVIQSADLPLGTLAGMVDSTAIDLEPAFQRRERWSVATQSALIESFLLNVPVPPIYLSEDSSGKYVAIDGKQRLRTIADFLAGRFSLAHLERLTEAEGYHFADLPEQIRNALQIKPFLRVVTLLRQSSPALKYEVFLRLNRAGEPLNRQEIRNVAYRGPFNDAIYRMARHDFLRQCLKITGLKSQPFRQMLDAEFVLRFLTLKSQMPRYTGRLADEMDEFLETNQTISTAAINAYKDDFKKTLDGCQRIWGEHAFRRSAAGAWRNQFLAGMFDAQMLAVSTLDSRSITRLERASEAVTSSTQLLFSDRSFDDAVRTGTNTPARLRLRVEKVQGVLLAHL